VEEPYVRIWTENGSEVAMLSAADYRRLMGRLDAAQKARDEAREALRQVIERSESGGITKDSVAVCIALYVAEPARTVIGGATR
jgi:PHD/YefM family antitoxin component YafN of YafNO toxin-antitoxin module